MESDQRRTSKSDLFYEPSSSILIVWGQFFVGIALYTLSYYLFDDGMGEWDGVSFDSSDILKVIISMMLLPFGLIFWQSSIFRLASHTGYHWIGNILFLIIFLISLFTVGSIYFVKWGVQSFIQWDINLIYPARMVQGIYLVLTLWLTGITTFHILLRAILQRDLYTIESMQGINNNNNNNNESLPLMTVNANTNQTQIQADDINTSDQGRPIGNLDRELEATHNRFFEYFSIFLFFFVFLPIFLYINCVFPSDWHRLTPYYINTLLSITWSMEDTWNSYFEFKCLNPISSFASYTICYARLYFDLIIWYTFVFAVSLFAYISNKTPFLRLLLRKRLLLNIKVYTFSLISITFGEILFWILWLTQMILIGYYFVVIHLWEGKETTDIANWGRFIGVLAVQFLSMQLFTITRIRLWIDCFSVSFEHLIAYHRVLGVFMLFCGYLHMTLMLIYWTRNDYMSGNLPFGSIPFTYNSDNWTMIMMYYIMIFLVPIIYIFGTISLIRRKYFEIFYYFHLFGGLIFISSILWHSSQSWRYIIPPLSLYVIDRMIRLSNSSRLCRCENINVSIDGNNNNNNIEITKLSFSCAHYSMKYAESSFKNIHFKMGQYAFINISNISLYEWHPFTISSGEDENISYFQIKNEGPTVSQNKYGNNLAKNAEFTTLLYLLAQQVSGNEKGTHDIDIHIDGPYGKAFEYIGYERVILIGGGIGVTPCHSIFSTLLSRASKYNGYDINGNKIPYVDLIWVTKEQKMFSMFTNTWRMYEDQNQSLNKIFNIKLYATRQDGKKVNINNDNNDDNDQKNDNDKDLNHVVPHTDAIMYTYGRPNWSNLLNNLINKNNNNTQANKTLVFVCGPKGMVDQVEQYSVKFGSQFYSESFQF